jgi:Domain of unknown function (DUF4129)
MVISGVSIGRLTASGPIGRIPAQRIARQELASGIYSHHSFWQWLLGELRRLYNDVGNAVPGGWWATVSMVALLVIVVAVVRALIGPVGRSRRQPAAALLGGARTMTADEHRDRAQRQAADGDYSGAIVEQVRAIAAGLAERELIVPGPARTADELASEASKLFPGSAAGLAGAARLFNDVCYGARMGTPDGYARVQRLDEELTNAKRPVLL